MYRVFQWNWLALQWKRWESSTANELSKILTLRLCLLMKPKSHIPGRLTLSSVGNDFNFKRNHTIKHTLHVPSHIYRNTLYWKTFVGLAAVISLRISSKMSTSTSYTVGDILSLILMLFFLSLILWQIWTVCSKIHNWKCCCKWRREQHGQDSPQQRQETQQRQLQQQQCPFHHQQGPPHRPICQRQYQHKEPIFQTLETIL